MAKSNKSRIGKLLKYTGTTSWSASAAFPYTETVG